MEKEMKEKSLPLAIGLNFILPGVGYMYMGKMIVGIGALLLIVLILVSSALITIFPVWLGLNLIMAIDMYMLDSKRKKKLAEQNTKKCPNCAEMIQKEAKVCRYCGRDLSITDPEEITAPQGKIKYIGGNPLWTCSQCGKSFNADTLNCPNCNLPKDKIAIRE